MFDANYFRATLPHDIEAAGGSPVVEVSLLNGHVHRVRAIAEVALGHVTLAVHAVKGDLSHERPRFGGAGDSDAPVRVAVSYESIAAVILDPAPDKVKSRPGFTPY
jgi:hypothetical protein